MKKTLIAALLASVTLTAVAEVKPFQATEYRRGVFKAVKWQFGPMADMMKGKKEFSAAEFVQRAENLAALSKMPLEGFVPNSYARGTRALPGIEQDWETFTSLMTDFERNTEALASAAASGDKGQIKPAFIQVAKTCKSCHDKFKD